MNRDGPFDKAHQEKAATGWGQATSPDTKKDSPLSQKERYMSNVRPSFMKNMTTVKWGFFGAKGMTDFDIGIGWQTRGNYDDFKQWVLSVIRLRRAGEISGRYFSLAIITILGFYARIYLLGPLMETNIQGQEENNREGMA